MANDVRVFNGNPILPSSISYAAYALTENLSLSWPKTGLQTGNVVADIIDVTPNAAGWIITMPDATQVSTGQESTFNNLATNNTYQFFVYDNSGSLIANVPAAATGEFSSIRIYLRDNTTAAGEWGLIQEGATAGGPQASQLAGRGLTASAPANLLSVNMSTSTKSTDYQVLAADRGKIIVWEGGTGTITLPISNASEIGNGFIVAVNNQSASSGQITILPSGSATINTFSFFTLGIDESSIFICDGTNWVTLGDGKDSFFSFNVLEKTIPPVSPQPNITLTDFEAAKQIQVFNSDAGDLLSDVVVIYPQAVNVYYIKNSTTGNFKLTVNASGSFLTTSIPQGTIMQFYCDGTNLYPQPTCINNLTSSNGTGIKLYNATNINTVGFLPPASIPSTINWTLPNADGSSKQALSTNGSGTLSWRTYIPQVLQTSLDSSFNTGPIATNTFVDVTGLSKTIVPNSAINQVLVTVTMYVSADNVIAEDILLRVTRTSPGPVTTVIGVGTPSGSQIAVGSIVACPDISKQGVITYTFLDSPASVSTQVYQVQIAGIASGPTSYHVNQSADGGTTNVYAASISTITLTEVIV